MSFAHEHLSRAFLIFLQLPPGDYWMPQCVGATSSAKKKDPNDTRRYECYVKREILQGTLLDVINMKLFRMIPVDGGASGFKGISGEKCIPIKNDEEEVEFYLLSYDTPAVSDIDTDNPTMKYRINKNDSMSAHQ